LAIAATVAVLLFHGVVLYWAGQMPRLRPAPPGPAAGLPSTSDIVAARNEVDDLPNCLDGLLHQDVALQLIVVDGASTDGTPDVARRAGPRVQLIEEGPLPPGWVGKNWACELGAEASTGDWLLFTDADVRYAPEAVRRCLEWAQAEHADLATLAPKVEMVGFWEKVVLPFYVQSVVTYFRAPRVNRDDSRAAMANGQFLMVRRKAYDQVGGHRAVRGAVLEDVRLAQEFRRAGLRLRLAWAPELITTRMYRDRHEMFEGLLKNIHGTDYSTARQVGFLAGLIGLYWLPLALLPVGLALSSPLLTALGALLWVALFGKHVAFTAAIRARGAYGLLYPLAVGYYIAIVLASIRSGLRHEPLEWKGRRYARPGE
jgi:chlorobactene glucosyltransferase